MSCTLIDLIGFALIFLFILTAEHFWTTYQGKLANLLQAYQSRLQKPGLVSSYLLPPVDVACLVH